MPRSPQVRFAPPQPLDRHGSRCRFGPKAGRPGSEPARSDPGGSVGARKNTFPGFGFLATAAPFNNPSIGSSIMTFDELLSKEPDQWGLRGDPYLWREMRGYLAGQPVPSRDVEIYEAVAAAFEALTGKSMESIGHVYVERYAHGGMSSGHVDPEFWRTDVQRFLREIRSSEPASVTRTP